MMADESKPQSWWQTLPGLLTALAGLITATTGAIIAINQFKAPASTATPPSSSSSSSAPLPAAAPPATASATSPPVQPDTVKAELRNVIRDMRLGNPDYQRMDPRLAALMRQHLPAFRSRTDTLGPIQKLTFDSQQDGVYVYDVKFANGSMIWRIKFDILGKIAVLAWSFDQSGGAAGAQAPKGG